MRRQGYSTQLCWRSSSGERRQKRLDAVWPAHSTASAAAAMEGTDRLWQQGRQGWHRDVFEQHGGQCCRDNAGNQEGQIGSRQGGCRGCLSGQQDSS